MPEVIVTRGNWEKFLYRQVYDSLIAKIGSGEWPAGTLIPSEKALCELYEVSRATVKSALTLLVSQGFLMRIQGKGTFVCDKRECRGDDLASLRKILVAEISHQVNNPLAVIREKAGWLHDLLTERDDSKGDIGEYLDIIKKIEIQVDHVRALTHALTDLPEKIELIRRERSYETTQGNKNKN